MSTYWKKVKNLKPFADEKQESCTSEKKMQVFLFFAKVSLKQSKLKIFFLFAKKKAIRRRKFFNM